MSHSWCILYEMFRGKKTHSGIKQPLARFLPNTSGKIKQSEVQKEAPQKNVHLFLKPECKEYKSIK